MKAEISVRRADISSWTDAGVGWSKRSHSWLAASVLLHPAAFDATHHERETSSKRERQVFYDYTRKTTG